MDAENDYNPLSTQQRPCKCLKIEQMSNRSLPVKKVRIKYLSIIIVLLLVWTPCLANDQTLEYVVLLHGLARTQKSMTKMEKRLYDEGFGVLNIGYPSRSKTIEELAEEIIPNSVTLCREKGAQTIHFVTHSLGGIIVRYYLKHHHIPELGRVVMLSPPNGGSEVVDKFRQNFIFKWLNGPAGQQLGTGKDSLPKKLGSVAFELGVIAGDRSINLFLSLVIPGTDDGKVSVTNAKVDGMKDFIIINSSHPFIMKNRHAIKQTIAFLRQGEFKRD
jgi:hypothetical protein